MARVRGVEPGSREELEHLVTAVLNRDPGTGARIRAELQARRDAAANSLAFELAGRVQAELAALDWVLSEQKVTQLDHNGDIDLHGWSAGLLVTFHMRQGRVRSWTQERCDQIAAKVRVDATPEGWRSFTERNAALAARLVSQRE
jgi:excinuclease ABC subunit C